MKTVKCLFWLNKQLMDFAQGKILMVLEGGYNLDSIANSALACVEVLLYEKPISGSCDDYPFESTWRVIQKVRRLFLLSNPFISCGFIFHTILVVFLCHFYEIYSFSKCLVCLVLVFKYKILFS